MVLRVSTAWLGTPFDVDRYPAAREGPDRGEWAFLANMHFNEGGPPGGGPGPGGPGGGRGAPGGGPGRGGPERGEACATGEPGRRPGLEGTGGREALERGGRREPPHVGVAVAVDELERLDEELDVHEAAASVLHVDAPAGLPSELAFHPCAHLHDLLERRARKRFAVDEPAQRRAHAPGEVP